MDPDQSELSSVLSKTLGKSRKGIHFIEQYSVYKFNFCILLWLKNLCEKV